MMIRLTDCFMEVVAYVVYFVKNAAVRQPPFDAVKGDITRLMTKSETLQKEGGASYEDYNMARFAVCAWIDEAIMSSAWNEKNRWQRELLQRTYFQTTDAGELFFDKLNAIGPHQQDVREVYYLCLTMGFTGRFINDGDDYLLDQLKTSNLKLLTGSSMGVPSLENRTLFPDSYPKDFENPEEAKRSRWSMGVLLSIGLPAVFFLVLFIIYHFILGSVGDNILKTVAS